MRVQRTRTKQLCAYCNLSPDFDSTMILAIALDQLIANVTKLVLFATTLQTHCPL